MSIQVRTDILATYGATSSEIEELLAYNQNIFDHSHLKEHSTFPLESEPHIATWETYLSQSKTTGVFEELRSKLVQFQFPILPEISQTENYRAATRQGKSTAEMPEATGLVLQHPENLQLEVHSTLAGKIPVLIAGCRQDFISIVRALTKRNEPYPIPDSMGAVMVAGYNNWHRIRSYRQAWELQQIQPTSEIDWQREFKRLSCQKHLYQDRFIILSPGGYSGISATEMGMTEVEWLEVSLAIRLEHECTHYLTRRLLGSMRNNLMDELMADYRGIVVANNGYYRADWFLRFLGLEAFPNYRVGGRLENYRGDPPLSEGAFKVLQALVKDAAENLERFHLDRAGELLSQERQAHFSIALSYLTLEELASSREDLLNLEKQ